jgi:hypothetical protein
MNLALLVAVLSVAALALIYVAVRAKLNHDRDADAFAAALPNPNPDNDTVIDGVGDRWAPDGHGKYLRTTTYRSVHLTLDQISKFYGLQERRP